MVGVAIGAVGAKRCNDLRPDFSDETHDFGLNLGGIGTIQVTIHVVEKINFTNAQFFARRARFSLTYLPYDMRLRPHWRVAEPAALSPGGRNEIGLDAFFRVFCEGSSHS